MIAEELLEDNALKAAFAGFVHDAAFPCLGAKAAFNAGTETVSIYDYLASDESTDALAHHLRDFVSSRHPENAYATYVAIFREPRNLDEKQFERLLWMQLRQLHQIDRKNQQWDPRVSSDPSDPRFSFSFAGQALYVVGLHAGSSRIARRFAWPTLVFNPHAQFERIRHDGKWKRMQETIRNRDQALQGSSNPMLSDFGEKSEARQYSGRAVGEGWRAPFPLDKSDDGKSRCPFGH